jgi:AcrR family transcriptional regulator
MVTAQGRLAQSRRRAAEREIEGAALALFLERGFAATTMDDVAAAVGTSRSSVFRYFATKEDLLLASMRETGDRLVAQLQACPQQQSAWQSATDVLLRFAAEFDAGGQPARRRARLLADTPALQQALAGKHQAWKERFADALVDRVPGRGAARRLKAEAFAACALACLDVAVTAWARSDAGPTAAAQLATVYDAIASTA